MPAERTTASSDDPNIDFPLYYVLAQFLACNFNLPMEVARANAAHFMRQWWLGDRPVSFQPRSDDLWR